MSRFFHTCADWLQGQIQEWLCASIEFWRLSYFCLTFLRARGFWRQSSCFSFSLTFPFGPWIIESGLPWVRGPHTALLVTVLGKARGVAWFVFIFLMSVTTLFRLCSGDCHHPRAFSAFSGNSPSEWFSASCPVEVVKVLLPVLVLIVSSVAWHNAEVHWASLHEP